MGFSMGHLVVVLLIVLVLFGAGRLSGVMGEAGKGIRAFKDGLKGNGEDDKKSLPGNKKAD